MPTIANRLITSFGCVILLSVLIAGLGINRLTAPDREIDFPIGDRWGKISLFNKGESRQ